MVGLKCNADFCLIPMGTESPSVSTYIAEIQVLMHGSGLKYTMHSAGTTVEGPWDQVMELIGKAHELMHKLGVQRVQTDVRIGTRVDKTQSFEDKVTVVEKILKEKEKAQASSL
ncbi:YkoF-like protein [Lipomyces tetrasporus]|uniref:YkoF-like protein n=1 Tax=Lipomyces tetrasporus TaxID=54092 RepID=A0AAD7QLC4_9ASCO|nr:YkoF-like protein [Lipomyces tetrasporus]KAJ8097392.1 YkoF-like protein [Lipomyces tetrasporus]